MPIVKLRIRNTKDNLANLIFYGLLILGLIALFASSLWLGIIASVLLYGISKILFTTENLKPEELQYLQNNSQIKFKYTEKKYPIFWFLFVIFLMMTLMSNESNSKKILQIGVIIIFGLLEAFSKLKRTNKIESTIYITDNQIIKRKTNSYPKVIDLASVQSFSNKSKYLFIYEKHGECEIRKGKNIEQEINTLIKILEVNIEKNKAAANNA